MGFLGMLKNKIKNYVKTRFNSSLPSPSLIKKIEKDMCVDNYANNRKFFTTFIRKDFLKSVRATREKAKVNPENFKLQIINNANYSKEAYKNKDIFQLDKSSYRTLATAIKWVYKSAGINMVNITPENFEHYKQYISADELNKIDYKKAMASSSLYVLIDEQANADKYKDERKRNLLKHFTTRNARVHYGIARYDANKESEYNKDKKFLQTLAKKYEPSTQSKLIKLKNQLSLNAGLFDVFDNGFANTNILDLENKPVEEIEENSNSQNNGNVEDTENNQNEAMDNTSESASDEQADESEDNTDNIVNTDENEKTDEEDNQASEEEKDSNIDDNSNEESHSTDSNNSNENDKTEENTAKNDVNIEEILKSFQKTLENSKDAQLDDLKKYIDEKLANNNNEIIDRVFLDIYKRIEEINQEKKKELIKEEDIDKDFIYEILLKKFENRIRINNTEKYALDKDNRNILIRYKRVKGEKKEVYRYDLSDKFNKMIEDITKNLLNSNISKDEFNQDSLKNYAYRFGLNFLIDNLQYVENNRAKSNCERVSRIEGKRYYKNDNDENILIDNLPLNESFQSEPQNNTKMTIENLLNSYFAALVNGIDSKYAPKNNKTKIENKKDEKTIKSVFDEFYQFINKNKKIFYSCFEAEDINNLELNASIILESAKNNTITNEQINAFNSIINSLKDDSNILANDNEIDLNIQIFAKEFVEKLNDLENYINNNLSVDNELSM